jgi:hypothetical protein
MIILFNGQHMGWGIFNTHLKIQTWAKGLENFYIQYAIVSWYLMAIPGMLTAWFLNNRLKKCDIYVSRIPKKYTMDQKSLNFDHF